MQDHLEVEIVPPTTAVLHGTLPYLTALNAWVGTETVSRLLPPIALPKHKGIGPFTWLLGAAAEPSRPGRRADCLPRQP